MFMRVLQRTCSGGCGPYERPTADGYFNYPGQTCLENEVQVIADAPSVLRKSTKRNLLSRSSLLLHFLIPSLPLNMGAGCDEGPCCFENILLRLVVVLA